MKPTKRILTYTRYEYVVHGPGIYGKDVDDAIQWARNEMESIDIRSDYDDSVKIELRDDDFVAWFEVKITTAPMPATITEEKSKSYAAGMEASNKISAAELEKLRDQVARLKAEQSNYLVTRSDAWEAGWRAALDARDHGKVYANPFRGTA